MKKKINCFIPFGNPKDTIQTVKRIASFRISEQNLPAKR